MPINKIAYGLLTYFNNSKKIRNAITLLALIILTGVFSCSDEQSRDDFKPNSGISKVQSEIKIPKHHIEEFPTVEVIRQVMEMEGQSPRNLMTRPDADLTDDATKRTNYLAPPEITGMLSQPGYFSEIAPGLSLPMKMRATIDYLNQSNRYAIVCLATDQPDPDSMMLHQGSAICMNIQSQYFRKYYPTARIDFKALFVGDIYSISKKHGTVLKNIFKSGGVPTCQAFYPTSRGLKLEPELTNTGNGKPEDVHNDLEDIITNTLKMLQYR